MGKHKSFLKIIVLASILAVFFTACGGGESGESPVSGLSGLADKVTGGGFDEDPDAPDRDASPRILENLADGSAAVEGNGAVVDYSHVNDGYVMIRYQGDNSKIKVQITKTGGDTYTYDLKGTEFVAFPLSGGSGEYSVAVFLNISDNQYAQAVAQTVYADIADEFQPFLRANQFSNFTSSTNAVAKAQELATGAKSDIGVVYKVFEFVTKNVKYDYEKAATVQSGYIPDVDETLSTGKGICFDYSALMVSMLRSQGIPCELIVGYAGEAYHAWISVHIRETGKVINIEFKGDQWTLMDPTFVAGGDMGDPNVIGDGENYTPVYYY